MNFLKIQYKKMPLAELVIEAKKNNYKALEELVKREQKNVFATFSYLNKKQDNVADLTQEALLKMAKNIGSLKNPKTFKSWLNQIVTHLFYDDLRKKQRRPICTSLECGTHDNPEKPFHTEIPDKKCIPIEKCMSHELDNLIKSEIRNLPDNFRIPIILRELQGLTYEEIANATHTNVGTVKSRIARARGKLQENLKEYI